MKKNDPTFKRKFGINTPIVYLDDVIVQKGFEERFKRSWARRYKTIDPGLSPTRLNSFKRYINKFREDGDEAYTSKVSIRYVSKTVGYGAFSKTDVKPYTVLGHYAGIFKPEKNIDPDNDSTFTFGEFKPYSIDAMRSGNWTRFMNHGVEKSSINVASWEFFSPDFPRIIFTAGSKGIKKGDQLLYSYGDEYWDEEEISVL